MDKFESIKNVWDNLEEKYQSDKSCDNRLDFVKKLLNYKNGSAGVLALLKIIQEASGGHSSEEVIELCDKIRTTSRNLVTYIAMGTPCDNFEQLYSKDGKRITIDDMTIGFSADFITLKETLAEESIIPIERIQNSTLTDGFRLEPFRVPDYIGVFPDKDMFREFLLLLSNSKANESVAKAILEALQATGPSYPIVVMDDNVFKDVSQVFGVQELFKGSVSLYDVTDKFATTRVMVIDCELNEGV